MQKEGVIARTVAVVDPKHVGRTRSFIVELQIERPELMAQLRQWLAEQAHVQQVFYVMGEADFILVVPAPDTETYDLLMSRLISENPNVKRFTTNVALSMVKRGGAPLCLPLLTEWSKHTALNRSADDRVTFELHHNERWVSLHLRHLRAAGVDVNNTEPAMSR